MKLFSSFLSLGQLYHPDIFNTKSEISKSILVFIILEIIEEVYSGHACMNCIFNVFKKKIHIQVLCYIEV